MPAAKQRSDCKVCARLTWESRHERAEPEKTGEQTGDPWHGGGRVRGPGAEVAFPGFKVEAMGQPTSLSSRRSGRPHDGIFLRTGAQPGSGLGVTPREPPRSASASASSLPFPSLPPQARQAPLSLAPFSSPELRAPAPLPHGQLRAGRGGTGPGQLRPAWGPLGTRAAEAAQVLQVPSGGEGVQD